MGKHIGVLPHPQVMDIARAGYDALQVQSAGAAAALLTQASIEALRAQYGEGAVAIWGYQIAVSIKGGLIATGMLDDGRIQAGLVEVVDTFPDHLVEELTGFGRKEEMVDTILHFYEKMPGNLAQIEQTLDHYAKSNRLHDPHGEKDPDNYQGPADWV